MLGVLLLPDAFRAVVAGRGGLSAGDADALADRPAGLWKMSGKACGPGHMAGPAGRFWGKIENGGYRGMRGGERAAA